MLSQHRKVNPVYLDILQHQMVYKTYLQFYGNQIFNFRLCQQITVECATFSSQSVDKIKIAHWVRSLVTPS